MATKEQVTEYIDNQWEDAYNTWWIEETAEIKGSKMSIIQNWMSPEIAGILQKLVGDAIMVSRIAKNRSNK